MIPDYKLREALQKYVLLVAEAHPDQPNLPFVLSKEYKEKIKLLREISVKKKTKKLVCRTFLIAAIILIFSTATALAFEPVRNFLYQIIQTVFTTHTEVSVKITDNPYLRTIEFEKKTLGNIPERFELASEQFFEKNRLYTAYYEENGNTNGYLRYTQRFIEGEKQMNIDNEEQVHTKISIGDQSIFLEESATDVFAYWTSNGYLFQLQGSITENEIKEIHNSIIGQVE